MKIYIPTYKRDVVRTLRYIPPEWMERTSIVVEERDEKRIRKADVRCNKIVVPEGRSKHIGDTRQYILDLTRENKIMFLDDDITIQVLKNPGRHNLREANFGDFRLLLNRLEYLLDLYPLVGASARNEAHLDFNKRFQINARIIRWLGVDVSFARRNNICFNRVPTSEDYDFHLQILRRGVQTVKDCTAFVGDGGSNRPGEGCYETHSHYADGESQKIIQSLHPDFVKLVTKTGSGWTRTDVQVQWKKAYQWGVAHAI